jgi:LPS export ABC transporter protein LptC
VRDTAGGVTTLVIKEMPFYLTRKQSIILGIGFLATFFVASGVTIYLKNSKQFVRKPELPSPLTSPTLSAPENSNTPNSGEAAATLGPGFTLNEFHRSLVKDGKLVWEIRGAEGHYDPLKSTAQISKPRLNAVRENGDPVNIVADRAELKLSAAQLQEAQLFDGVVITYRGDTTLKSSHAVYRQAEGLVEVAVPFELQSPMFGLTGKHLIAKLEAQEVVITKGVKSVIYPGRKGVR